MRVLGIESSCDETGVALYDTERGLVGHAVHTQVAMHEAYGGVVPELASRDHIRRLIPLLQRVLDEAHCSRQDIDAIAYTAGPGLAGALLVGASFAEALALALDVPALPVHHLEGHLLSPLLGDEAPAFPFIALLVSGGHTQLMRVARVGDYQLLGESLDDAAGEAFDKTAKLLGLGYPGGRALDDLARIGARDAIVFPRGMTGPRDDRYAFSFSGLKTAVARYVESRPDAEPADVAAGFQEAVADVLTAKAVRAATDLGVSTLLIAGGVAANSRLRELAQQRCAAAGLSLRIPRPRLCTDNGAMIASFAAHLVAAGARPSTLEAACAPGLPVSRGQVA